MRFHILSSPIVTPLFTQYHVNIDSFRFLLDLAKQVPFGRCAAVRESATCLSVEMSDAACTSIFKDLDFVRVSSTPLYDVTRLLHPPFKIIPNKTY